MITFCNMPYPDLWQLELRERAAPTRRPNIRQISASTMINGGRNPRREARPKAPSCETGHDKASCLDWDADVIATGQHQPPVCSLDSKRRTGDIALRLPTGTGTIGLNLCANILRAVTADAKGRATQQKAEKMRVPFLKEM